MARAHTKKVDDNFRNFMNQQKGKLHTDIQFLPADKLVKNNWNPNYIRPDILEAIKNNISKYGMIGPIVVQKFNKAMNKGNVIINGEHRFEILVGMGYKHIPCLVLDVNDSDAKILTLRLNREHGELLPDKISELLKSISVDAGQLIEMTQMSKKELDIYLSLSKMEVPPEALEVFPEDAHQMDTLMSSGLEERQQPESGVRTSTDPQPAFEPRIQEKDDKLYYDWTMVEYLVKKACFAIQDKKRFKTIIAVGNGGMVPARLVARELGVDDIRLIKYARKFRTPPDLTQISDLVTSKDWDKVLLVDDILDTGKTFLNIAETIRAFTNNQNMLLWGLFLLCRYMKNASQNHFIGDLVGNDKYCVFPWERM